MNLSGLKWKPVPGRSDRWTLAVAGEDPLAQIVSSTSQAGIDRFGWSARVSENLNERGSSSTLADAQMAAWHVAMRWMTK